MKYLSLLISIVCFLCKGYSQVKSHFLIKDIDEKFHVTVNYGAEGFLPLFPKIGYYAYLRKGSSLYVGIDIAPMQTIGFTGTYGLTLGYRQMIVEDKFYLTMDHASNFNCWATDAAGGKPLNLYFTHNYKIGIGIGKMMLLKFGPSFASGNEDLLDILPKFKRGVYLSSEVIFVLDL